eukprot:1678808-Rhodomonas_salina.1
MSGTSVAYAAKHTCRRSVCCLRSCLLFGVHWHCVCRMRHRLSLYAMCGTAAALPTQFRFFFGMCGADLGCGARRAGSSLGWRRYALSASRGGLRGVLPQRVVRKWTVVLYSSGLRWCTKVDRRVVLRNTWRDQHCRVAIPRSRAGILTNITAGVATRCSRMLSPTEQRAFRPACVALAPCSYALCPILTLACLPAQCMCGTETSCAAYQVKQASASSKRVQATMRYPPVHLIRACCTISDTEYRVLLRVRDAVTSTDIACTVTRRARER